MPRSISNLVRNFCLIHLLLSSFASAQDDASLAQLKRKSSRGYWKGDLLPVSCLNRSLETGEHITDTHGNLQYIPFPTCNETGLPLAFPYATPQTQTCTIDLLPDELYHLIEFFVHSDVPLACRVPSFPLSLAARGGLERAVGDKDLWTPFTVALQGALQLSHLHLQTNINVLFHTSPDPQPGFGDPSSSVSHLIASTAYSVPNATLGASPEGQRVVRNEPLVFSFNVGWIDGAVLPGMVGRPVIGLRDHNIGFSLLSFFALAASAGVGAIGMLVYERRKSGRSMNGLLGGNTGNGTVGRTTGYGGYGGYGGYNTSTGKKD